jgi:hypothetical protein
MSADAATAPLSANSETAAVGILDSATAGDGASQWWAFTYAWVNISILGYLKLWEQVRSYRSLWDLKAVHLSKSMSYLVLFSLISSDFKTHQLPLARIKKIMKSDEDVKVGISLFYFLFCIWNQKFSYSCGYFHKQWPWVFIIGNPSVGLVEEPQCLIAVSPTFIEVSIWFNLIAEMWYCGSFFNTDDRSRSSSSVFESLWNVYLGIDTSVLDSHWGE